jgi:hypothetical protein
MDITRIGTSIVPTSTHNLSLDNVLRVPAAQENLISIHGFTPDNDTFIEIHPFFILIKDQKMRNVLLQGHLRAAYILSLHQHQDSARLCPINAIKISVDRWHSCLCHPSWDIIHHVISKNNLPCATFDNSIQSVCDACACVKAHQLPYPVSSSRSSAPLEHIFSDVWGPAIENFGCKKYCLIY